MRYTFALFLLLVLGFVGCGKSSGDYGSAEYGATPPASMEPKSAVMDGAPGADATGGETQMVSSQATAPTRRSVIRRAKLAVRVDNVEKAEAKVNSLVAQLGGYVEGSESNDLSSVQAQIAITARVPVETFEKAISGFESLGSRLSKTISGEDVTAQVLDYSARLKTMRVQEEVYRDLLKQSKKMDDVIALQNQLMELRTRIEGTAAQLKGLSELAALSTVEVSLVQSFEAASKAQTDRSWAKEAWAEALGSGLAFLKTLTVAAMWLVVYSPIWVGLILFIRYLIRVGKNKPNPPV